MAVWQPIDFHGIVTLNKSVVSELREYLQLKEALLASVIAQVIPPLPGELLPPLMQAYLARSMTLLEGVEALTERLNNCRGSHDRQLLSNQENAVAQINKALWDYIELLESIAVEFFQQLDQIGFESWGKPLIDVVDAMKVLLQEELQDIDKAINLIEEQLRSYNKFCKEKAGFAARVKGLFTFNILDKDLRSNIVKTEKFIGFRYQTFMHRVEQYELLHQSTELSTKKFDSYLIFEKFDERQREMFVHLYQWIRVWELNQTTKSLPEREPIRAIRTLQAPEKIFQFFKDYAKALREALFTRSRMIKLQPNSLIDLISKIQHQHALQGQMAELHTLGTTIRKYRDFLLRTDPNPYIRSRLGFGEWIVGPEPAIAKNLVDLIFVVESLDNLFKKLMKSVEEGDLPTGDLEKIQSEVQRILHEMAQPLASYALMLSKGKVFVQKIQEINELGSTHPNVVDLVGDALSRALRSDWKFHVLHEIPHFHEIYAIHQGIIGSADDRSHLNRIHRFKKLTHRIQEWVKNNDTHKHMSEIEVDVSDLKGYLQDFLAHVQRIAKDAEDENRTADVTLVRNMSNQLLEYRYLFGHFFQHLRRDNAEERVVRNQFLFVDQYFETIENKLQELKGHSAR